MLCKRIGIHNEKKQWVEEGLIFKGQELKRSYSASNKIISASAEFLGVPQNAIQLGLIQFECACHS